MPDDPQNPDDNDLEGPIASPAVVQVPGDNRYFMAFSGGNADYIAGKVYWAVSPDGKSWDVYDWNLPEGETWTPVVYGKYADDCSGGIFPYSNGVGQVQLAYDPTDGYFYLFVNYYHPDNKVPGGALSSVAYRFLYDTTGLHPFGFGGSNQIYYQGSWVAHSGKLVWSYDAGATEPGDPRFNLFDSMHTYQFGAGDLKWDPRYNTWLRVADFGGAKWQINSSLASPNWHNGSGTAGTYGTITSMPSNYTTGLGSGLWYGTLASPEGPVSAMWMFIPVDRGGCDIPVRSLSILPARLDRY